MMYEPSELNALPEIMTKEEFRRVCHISKRTALYLIQGELIPCEKTGKKTRCYFIKKSDVIHYLHDRMENPEKYIAPEKWYKYSGPLEKKPYVIRLLPFDNAGAEKITKYYTKELKSYPDVMDVNDICMFTGYNRRTVSIWCRKHRLKFLTDTPKYLIPKCFLLEYLLSDYYNNTIRKSKKHVDALWKINGQNPHIRPSRSNGIK